MKTGADFLCILSLSFLFSCASIDKIIDSGNFDTALNKVSRKIIGKKRIQEKHVRAIEEAFTKVMAEDLDLILRRERSNRSVDHAEILKIYDRINRRQNHIKALLPIEAKSGYQAKFVLIDTHVGEAQARQSYLDLTYREASSWLEQGREGDRKSAQLAFELFETLWDHASTFKDARLLQAEAYDLGLVEVGVDVINMTGMELPDKVISTLLRNGFGGSEWIQFHQAKEVRSSMDQSITLELAHFDVGAEQWVERQTTNRAEIEGGFEYQLDQDGNVVKDSLGNDVKIPLWETIEAIVTEIQQEKQGILSAVLWLRDQDHNVLDHTTLQTESVFEHFSAAFVGDKRALNQRSRKYLGQMPLPYPANEVLFQESVLSLAPILKRRLKELYYRKDLAMH